MCAIKICSWRPPVAHAALCFLDGKPEWDRLRSVRPIHTTDRLMVFENKMQPAACGESHRRQSVDGLRFNLLQSRLLSKNPTDGSRWMVKVQPVRASSTAIGWTLSIHRLPSVGLL